MVTEQVPRPLQPLPDQPAKIDEASATAVSTTAWPSVTAAEHAGPQSIPAGDEVIDPSPVPAFMTVSGTVPSATATNDAVTLLASDIVTVQVPVPLQFAPDQPANTEVASGVATNVTTVFSGMAAAQVVPQLIPAGDDVTEPSPEPTRDTVSAKLLDGSVVKVATTLAAACTVIEQVGPAPEQAPDQPPKNAFAAGVAVSTTIDSPGNDEEQVAPQEIPAGADDTVPLPVPCFVTPTA